MEQSAKNLKQIGIFVIIAFGLIYWQYSVMSAEELSEIKTAFQSTQWQYLLYAIVIGFLSHLFRALRWRLLLSPIGVHTTIKNSTFSVLIGYLANTLVPRLGEIMRCTTLAKYDKAPFDKSIGTVISERLFDTLCLAIIFILVFTFEYEILSQYAYGLFQQFFYDDQGNVQTGKFAWLIIVGIIGFIAAIFIFKKIKNTKYGQLLARILLGLKSILLLRQRGLFILYSVGIWICYILMVLVAMKAVPDTAHLGFLSAMAITAFGSFAMIVTPGGIGAYPPIVAGILSLYGISFASGLALGWVSWLMQTIVVLLLGISSLILLPILNSKISTQSISNE